MLVSNKVALAAAIGVVAVAAATAIGLPRVLGAPVEPGTLQTPLHGKYDPSRRYEIDVTGAPSRGPEHAAVTIVTFGDFESPYYRHYLRTLNRIFERYSDDVRFVWKNRPLPKHHRSLEAHEAAMIAHRMGSFWGMHDLLMSHPELSRDRFLMYADALGLDVDAFAAALDEHTYLSDVERDVADAAALQVWSVPTTFVNGRAVTGTRSFETLSALIEQEILRARNRVGITR